MGAVVRADSSCVGGAVFGPAPLEQKLAALTPPGCSRVSPVFRSVAQSEWSSGPAHTLAIFVLCVGLWRNGAESERRKSW